MLYPEEDGAKFRSVIFFGYGTPESQIYAGLYHWLMLLFGGLSQLDMRMMMVSCDAWQLTVEIANMEG